MMDRDETRARVEWQAERGGRVIWLSGRDGVEISSLIARAISDWQQAGQRVLFTDLSPLAVCDAEEHPETERRVLERLLGPDIDRARATPALWHRFEQILAAEGRSTRVILDRVEAARAPGRRLVATIRHQVTRHGATLVVVSPRDESVRSRTLAAWTDLEVGSVCDGGVVERAA
ncbi:MAG TPA: hypothetical protein DCE47_11760 [Planctomycetaceae bacterium]|nr:hypothetical protein [Planctomycetaceae bacterium]|tara:strand:- start:1054 stop:1578 length:525 start_codon:yes stop_codon:yes gene_type:complete